MTTSALESRPGATPPRARRAPRNPLPWILLAPTFALLAALVGYPLVRLIILSFQEYGAPQLYGAPVKFVGFANYTKILSDSEFWIVLGRSFLFMVVAVFLTLLLGTLVALLMIRLPKFFQFLVSIGMLLAWAMPALTATIVMGWMFDTQIGVINYVLELITGNEAWRGHSWLDTPLSFFTVLTIIIVWGAVPFVAFTMYAGLTQIPGEVLEAAQLDGANPIKRFFLIQIPYVRSILTVLIVLSVIWDLRVFTQVFVLQGMGGIASETNTLGVYIYHQAFSKSDYGVASAIGVIMVIILMAISLYYVRSTVKEEGL